jgi:hypothetical protein
MEIRHLLPFVSGRLTLPGKQVDTLLGGLQGGKRAGENGLLHGHALQLLLFPASVHATLGESDREQGAVGGFFSR